MFAPGPAPFVDVRPDVRVILQLTSYQILYILPLYDLKLLVHTFCYGCQTYLISNRATPCI